MRKYKVFPIEMVRGMLSLAMANPDDQSALEHLRILVGCELKVIPTSEKEIFRALRDFLPNLDEIPTCRDLMVDPNTLAPNNKGQKGEESQIIRVVNKLIDMAIENHASDIHLEPQRKGLFARLRIDGVLRTIHGFPVEAISAIISRIKIMANMDISEKRLPQAGQITVPRGNQHVGLRISVVPGTCGEKVVIRVLEKSRMDFDLGNLGLPSQIQSEIEGLIERPHGLVLVTGPTGTGKSTTLYALLKQLISN
ncbi:hypothetical protein BVX98_03390, partial [bacterium F11]